MSNVQGVKGKKSLHPRKRSECTQYYHSYWLAVSCPTNNSSPVLARERLQNFPEHPVHIGRLATYPLFCTSPPPLPIVRRFQFNCNKLNFSRVELMKCRMCNYMCVQTQNYLEVKTPKAGKKEKKNKGGKIT